MQGELPVSHSVTGTDVDSSDVEKDTSDGISDQTAAKLVPLRADEAAHRL